jgi:hypothetical protein
MPKRQPLSIEVVEEAGVRFVVYEYANGEIVRDQVDPTKKREPQYRRFKPRSKSLDRTRKKRF